MMRLTGLVALLLAVIGCGEPPADLPTAALLPVTGTINVNGKPASGAQVTFHPVDAGATVTPSGIVDASGQFQLTTYTAADGAAAGKYQVTISWADVIKGGSDPEYGREKLPGRFQDPDMSGLVCEVKPDITEPLAFNIKTR